MSICGRNRIKLCCVGLFCATIFAISGRCLAQHAAVSLETRRSVLSRQKQNVVASTAPKAAVAQTIPLYPDSPKGLENLFKQMLKLEKRGDQNQLAPYIQSLILPHPRAWFRATFGEQIGAEMSNSYQRTRLDLPLSFPDTLQAVSSERLENAKAVLFKDSCSYDATDTEYPLLLRRVNDQPLYDVRFWNGTGMTFIPYFAFVDGAFRYLGNFKVSVRIPKGVKVAGFVVADRLIKQVLPDYPEDAKFRGMQGNVLLHVVITRGGEIADLQLIRGQCVLAKAAIDAVRQWRYRPYEINGQPVAVDTTITVIFNLGR